MSRRWFDDQNLIVVFNFFFSMFEQSWKYGKDLFACFVDLKKFNMIAFLSLEGSEEEWR